MRIERYRLTNANLEEVKRSEERGNGGRLGDL